ncbi:MAG: GYF domain-containing protein [Planctomycetia bacterium]
MADTPKNQRWGTPVEIFARKLSLEDNDIPRGWLKNSIIIEPGTRACAVVDGRFIGEIPAGEFTFHDIRDKLQFWRQGTATIVLTRSDVVRLPVECNGFISADDVPIEMRLDIGVQIHDPAVFMLNMMGPRKEYPVKELAERLTPAIKQEAWVATARLKAHELRGPAIAAKVGQQIVDAVAPSFRRYGLTVFSMEGLAMQPAGMEKHWERVKENNVDVAGERLTNQRMGDDVGILTDRIGLREKLRDVAISDHFDQARSEEELKTLIAQVDKARLLRREEMDQLLEGFEQRKDDRDALRRHIVEVLDVNRQQEIDQLRQQVGHSLEMAARKNELALAEATNSVENLQWRNEIAREIEHAEKRREERKKNLAAKWERIREVQRQKQDGSWERLLHQEREDSLRTELAVKEAERKRRVQLLEAESAAQVEAQKIVAERQRREFELEMGGRESDAQFDRLKRVQDMNFDGHARQAKLDAELAGQAESRAQSHELEKLKTMGTLSAEALIAASNGDNARVLAELKMQEARSQADVQIAGRSDQQALNEERLRLYEKLSEAEKSKSDAIADVFKQALRGQQDAVAQMIGGLAAAHTPARPAASPAVPPPVAAVGAEWHIAAGGGQSGPHTAQQVQAMIQRGQILADSLVWKAGMAGWVAIAECVEFASLLAAVPPPPPPRP